MEPIRPRPEDAPALAALHVAAWEETYAGLLPRTEIDRFDLTFRTRQWVQMLRNDRMRVAWVPGSGFAFSGPQRESDWVARGYPEELQAIYLLRAAQGNGAGQALFNAVRPPGPFMLWVLQGNDRAIRFYERMGGHLVETRPERIGETEIIEHAYGWSDPSASPIADATV